MFIGCTTHTVSAWELPSGLLFAPDRPVWSIMTWFIRGSGIMGKTHFRKGRGRTVVFQHGLLGGWQVWRAQIAAFAPYFDVIALNLPGFSDRADEAAPTTIVEIAAAQIALLDSLGVDRFSFVGHSLGGFTAQQVALTAGDRLDRLVLYGTAISSNLPGRFETHDQTIARVRRDGLEKAAPDLVASWFVAGRDDPNYGPTLELGLRSTVDAACNAIRAIQGWDATGRLGVVNAPTLVICGDRERNATPEVAYALWKALPHGRLCVLPDCAHAAHLERADFFNSVVGQFLGGDFR
ncbi:MAG: alpha/beta fold hydrolase [Alphaproteobacteria bacterium]|nr:alpha/beta fold hydrolase [Alphaproteobacteria bacterium]